MDAFQKKVRLLVRSLIAEHPTFDLTGWGVLDLAHGKGARHASDDQPYREVFYVAHKDLTTPGFAYDAYMMEYICPPEQTMLFAFPQRTLEECAGMVLGALDVYADMRRAWAQMSEVVRAGGRLRVGLPLFEATDPLVRPTFLTVDFTPYYRAALQLLSMAPTRNGVTSAAMLPCQNQK